MQDFQRFTDGHAAHTKAVSKRGLYHTFPWNQVPGSNLLSYGISYKIGQEDSFRQRKRVKINTSQCKLHLQTPSLF